MASVHEDFQFSQKDQEQIELESAAESQGGKNDEDEKKTGKWKIPNVDDYEDWYRESMEQVDPSIDLEAPSFPGMNYGDFKERMMAELKEKTGYWASENRSENGLMPLAVHVIYQQYGNATGAMTGDKWENQGKLAELYQDGILPRFKPEKALARSTSDLREIVGNPREGLDSGDVSVTGKRMAAELESARENKMQKTVDEPLDALFDDMVVPKAGPEYTLSVSDVAKRMAVDKIEGLLARVESYAKASYTRKFSDEAQVDERAHENHTCYLFPDTEEVATFLEWVVKEVCYGYLRAAQSKGCNSPFSSGGSSVRRSPVPRVQSTSSDFSQSMSRSGSQLSVSSHTPSAHTTPSTIMDRLGSMQGNTRSPDQIKWGDIAAEQNIRGRFEEHGLADDMIDEGMKQFLMACGRQFANKYGRVRTDDNGFKMYSRAEHYDQMLEIVKEVASQTFI
nr:hypothetical protein [Sicyoidochytrium minutum DNA virus]